MTYWSQTTSTPISASHFPPAFPTVFDGQPMIQASSGPPRLSWQLYTNQVPHTGPVRPAKRDRNSRKERRRTVAENQIYDQLRTMIPYVPGQLKISKIKILRLASTYIRYLTHLLEEQEPDQTPPADPSAIHGSFVESIFTELNRRNTYQPPIELSQTNWQPSADQVPPTEIKQEVESPAKEQTPMMTPLAIHVPPRPPTAAYTAPCDFSGFPTPPPCFGSFTPPPFSPFSPPPPGFACFPVTPCCCPQCPIQHIPRWG